MPTLAEITTAAVIFQGIHDNFERNFHHLGPRITIQGVAIRNVS